MVAYRIPTGSLVTVSPEHNRVEKIAKGSSQQTDRIRSLVLCSRERSIANVVTNSNIVQRQARLSLKSNRLSLVKGILCLP